MNILTFDIEEWFHILDHSSTKTEKEWLNFEYRLESNMDRILKLLDNKNQKATFFVLGWVARKFPNVLKKIDEMGYEIASHSDMHQLAYEQNRDEFRNDLRKSIHSIEDTIGKKVRIYRAPGFSIKADNQWVFDVLVENGIEIDCSIFPTKRAHGGFEDYGYAKPSLVILPNGKKIKEFPINLMNFGITRFIFSGGGYFRILPYFVIKQMFKNSDYVMSYFHPRDFDKGQPVIEDLSYLRRFKAYCGINGAFKKLEALIDDFDFIDIAQADKSIDWNLAKKIRLKNENTIFNGQFSSRSECTSH